MTLEQMLSRQQAITNAAREQRRDLTAEEQREFDTLQGQIDALRDQTQDPPPADPPAQPENTEPDAAQAARAAENRRVRDITAMCRDFGLEPDAYIADSSCTLEQAQRQVLAELKRRHPPAGARVTEDEGDAFREGAAEALMVRAGLVRLQDAPKANGLCGYSLRRLAEECLERCGVHGTRAMTDDTVFDHLTRQFFNPSGLFPSIMEQSINKSYAQGYEQVGYTFEKFCGEGSLRDFKKTDGQWLMGSAGEFLEVPEGGEIKHDLPVDAKLPSRQLKKFGRQFTITFEAFVNDDIDFVTSIPHRYAQSHKMTINKHVFNLLFGNPAIYDGKTLFHADHKNLLSTGSAPAIASLQKMLLKMKLQKDQENNAIVLPPKYILVPVGYQFDFIAMLESETIETPGNTQARNPLYHLAVEVLEDPTLNALVPSGTPAPWFLFADKKAATAIQVDYLNGQKTPLLKRSEKSGTLGFIWDFWGFWGVNPIDYRGVVKNPGVALDLE